MVAEELSWLPMASLVLVPLWWLWHTIVLYGSGKVAGGSGNVADTATVAGWGWRRASCGWSSCWGSW
ncbi:hypothetical protein SY89_01103 [Halolamina pelagica]|uniref:Uncharacterized protein n=1 Tax=Halolamina pelagica TaxID=699431 RepID=A0A0P7GNX9_9EURY|nr:hypothetical protein [Halolamina pelagica]KPN30374.1 hypothetical protein SY89_01103 [Halolamina pelagica]